MPLGRSLTDSSAGCPAGLSQSLPFPKRAPRARRYVESVPIVTQIEIIDLYKSGSFLTFSSSWLSSLGFVVPNLPYTPCVHSDLDFLRPFAWSVLRSEQRSVRFSSTVLLVLSTEHRRATHCAAERGIHLKERKSEPEKKIQPSVMSFQSIFGQDTIIHSYVLAEISR